MRHRIWLLLLVAGLAVVARPAGRRVRRVWHGWQDTAVWKTARGCPYTGKAGEPWCWLNIPKAGISYLVRSGPDRAALNLSPCAETKGNTILIMAHRDTHFRRLGRVGEGDLIELELRAGESRTYRCLETRILGKNDAESYVESQHDKDRLLLLTCYPFRYIGPAPRRYIVMCERCCL